MGLGQWWALQKLVVSTDALEGLFALNLIILAAATYTLYLF